MNHTSTLNPPSTMKPSSSLPLQTGGRFFFPRSEMDRLLSLSVLFSCVMVILRIIHTGRLTFITLIWNLFLAYIPYAITKGLTRKGCLFPGRCMPRVRYLLQEEGREETPVVVSAKHKAVFAFLFATWLLFIPNSFYIITDLFHLSDHHKEPQTPQWFDLAMILSFAWNGLLLGILSVRQMEKILQPLLVGRKELFFLYPIMWLSALGVYIGRYLRYNSWDVITNPFQLTEDITDMIIHPLRYHNAWDMIFCYSILMTLMYLMTKKVSKALA